MVDVGDLLSGENPVTGNSVSGLDGLKNIAVGTAMVVLGIRGGLYMANYVQDKSGVSEDDTTIRVA